MLFRCSPLSPAAACVSDGVAQATHYALPTTFAASSAHLTSTHSTSRPTSFVNVNAAAAPAAAITPTIATSTHNTANVVCALTTSFASSPQSYCHHASASLLRAVQTSAVVPSVPLTSAVQPQRRFFSSSAPPPPPTSSASHTATQPSDREDNTDRVDATAKSEGSNNNGRDGSSRVGVSSSSSSPPSSLWEVPHAVRQRVDASRNDLLCLLHRSTENGAAPAARLEAALSKQLKLPELWRQHRHNTKDATAAAAAATKVPSTWLAAAWAVLAPHCYFTLINASSPGGVNTSMRSNSASSTSIHNSKNGEVDTAWVSFSQLNVIPFDWSTAVEQLAAALPYEGWSEAQVTAHLLSQHRSLTVQPSFWPSQLPHADSLARFLHDHFPDELVVTRSAVTGHPLYHAAHRNSVSITWMPVTDTHHTSHRSSSSSKKGSHHASVSSGKGGGASRGLTSRTAATLQHALHTLGRGHQLPVWTDAAVIAPLLPVRSPLALARPSVWKAAWLADAGLRDCFSLDAAVRVRAAQLSTAPRLVVVVDATTVRGDTLPALLHSSDVLRNRDKNNERMNGAGAVMIYVLRRAAASTADSAASATNAEVESICAVLRSEFGEAAALEEVAVDALVDPVHVFGALLDSWRSRSDGSSGRVSGPSSDFGGAALDDVVVFCGDDVRPAFEKAMAEAAV